MCLVLLLIATKTARKVPANFLELKSDYLDRIHSYVDEHSIPEVMVINWDQTNLKLVPVSNWTLADKGSKQVSIVGLDDKREITVLLAASMFGSMLPPQILYQGTTDRCHAQVQFPEEWDIWHSSNHWSNEDTMLRYIDTVVIPYMDRQRALLQLPSQKGLCVFDMYRAHLTEKLKQKLLDNNLFYVYVPAGTTGELQPLDLTVNSYYKDQMKSHFHDWYSELVLQDIMRGEQRPVQFQISVLKPIHAKWVIQTHTTLEGNTRLIRKGFEKAGIIRSDTDSEADTLPPPDEDYDAEEESGSVITVYNTSTE